MFIKPKEAAKTLQTGVQYVYSLLWKGEIEAIRIGRHWRLVPESVNEYVERHPGKKASESSGHFIYSGNCGYLFHALSDNLQPDKVRKTSGMERRRGKLVHRPCRSDRILFQKRKPLTQLELFTS